MAEATKTMPGGGGPAFEITDIPEPLRDLSLKDSLPSWGRLSLPWEVPSAGANGSWVLRCLSNGDWASFGSQPFRPYCRSS